MQKVESVDADVTCWEDCSRPVFLCTSLNDKNRISRHQQSIWQSNSCLNKAIRNKLL